MLNEVYSDLTRKQHRKMGEDKKMCEHGECEQTGVLTLLISDHFTNLLQIVCNIMLYSLNTHKNYLQNFMFKTET